MRFESGDEHLAVDVAFERREARRRAVHHDQLIVRGDDVARVARAVVAELPERVEVERPCEVVDELVLDAVLRGAAVLRVGGCEVSDWSRSASAMPGVGR